MTRTGEYWKIAVAVGALLGITSAGCTAEVGEAGELDPGIETSAIIAGTVATSNTRLVAIYVRTNDYTGGSSPDPEIWWPRPCSGTALTNRIVLTAAHCVTNDAKWGSGAPVVAVSKMRLNTSLSPGIIPVAQNYTQTGSPPAGSITPQSIVIHPTEDIAIVKTATALTFPSGYELPNLSLEEVAARSVRGVSYGYGRSSLTNAATSNDPRTETLALGAGTLRTGLTTGTMNAAMCGTRVTITAATNNTGALFHGDSGGPTFDLKPAIPLRVPGACGPGGCPFSVFATQGVMGVHHSATTQTNIGCDDPLFRVLKWVQDQAGFGLRPSPIAQAVSNDYDLYLSGQDASTTTDLVIPAWPVGSSLAYDPAAGTLRSPSGLCLSDQSTTYPQLKTCNGGTRQQWSMAALKIKNIQTARCLDAADANYYVAGWNGNPSNRTKPYMNTCGDSPGQLWSWHF